MERAVILLENGKYFASTPFAASGVRTGEQVFNTGMTGYQEILADPSYKGQIVTMTCPLIGNYGVNEEDGESCGPQMEGFVVGEYNRYPSNWKASETSAIRPTPCSSTLRIRWGITTPSTLGISSATCVSGEVRPYLNAPTSTGY